MASHQQLQGESVPIMYLEAEEMPRSTKNALFAVFAAWNQCGMDSWNSLYQSFGGGKSARFGKDDITGIHIKGNMSGVA